MLVGFMARRHAVASRVSLLEWTFSHEEYHEVVDVPGKDWTLPY